MKYNAKLLMPRSALEVINKYLEAETEEDYQGEDNTITHSVIFPDGMLMDIKCCGCQDESSWTEAVLFIHAKDGYHEVCCSEVDESFLGEWELTYKGNTYCVDVLDGGDIDAPIVEHEAAEDAVAPDAEKWHGIVRWCSLDVIGAAKSNGIDMTDAEAEAWWAENERSFINLLAEHGNELLAEMTASFVPPSGPAPEDSLGGARELSQAHEREEMQASFTLAETPLGALVGHRATDPEHPGIYIDLHRDGEPVDAPVLLVEFANDDTDLEKGDLLITRVWDAVDEESYQTRVVHTGIDTYFANKEEK